MAADTTAPASNTDFDYLAWGALASTVGAAAGAYHGYERHGESAGWAVAWGLFGAAIPPVALVVALVQGYAEPSDSVRIRRIERGLGDLAGAERALTDGGYDRRARLRAYLDRRDGLGRAYAPSRANAIRSSAPPDPTRGAGDDFEAWWTVVSEALPAGLPIDRRSAREAHARGTLPGEYLSEKLAEARHAAANRDLDILIAHLDDGGEARIGPDGRLHHRGQSFAPSVVQARLTARGMGQLVEPRDGNRAHLDTPRWTRRRQS